MTLQLNGEFNGDYLRNETWYRQPRNGVGNYKGLLCIVSKCYKL